MLILDPKNEIEIQYAIHRAVRTSGISHTEISERLLSEYGVKLTVSGVSHNITRGGVRLLRALQILAICGVSEIEIKGVNPSK